MVGSQTMAKPKNKGGKKLLNEYGKKGEKHPNPANKKGDCK